MEKYYKWLEDNNYSINTIKTYTSILEMYKDILNDINAVKMKILTYKSSPNTCILHFNVIHSYMKWLKSSNLLELSLLKLPQVPIKYREVFSKEYLFIKTAITEKDNESVIKKKCLLDSYLNLESELLNYIQY